MLHLERAWAAVLLVCPLVLAVPAVAASRLDGLAESAVHLDILKQDVGQIGSLEHVTFDGLNDATSGKMEVRPHRASDVISDLVLPAAHDDRVVLTASGGQQSSTVPLPTGFSLFGAAILTLGLIGLLPGAHRRPALEFGGPAGVGLGPDAAEARPAAWFRIEVQSERGDQVRHIGSARGAIDLIADLLNEGWNVVRISDRDGLAIDYDDVIRAWRHERPN